METGRLDGVTAAAEAPAAEPRWTRRKIVTRALLLLATGVSIYLLLPSLVEVFSSWRSLGNLAPLWAVLMLPAEALSFAAVSMLQRLALRAHAWFPVATSQLSGNAFGRIVPGGGATATALQIGMLRQAGIGAGRAAAALTATQGLLAATLLALPLLSVPAIIGGAPVAHSLAVAAYLGVAVLAALLIGGGVAFVTERPVRIVARAIQWAANRTLRRKRPISDLGGRVVAERNFIRATVGEHWFRAVTAATAVAAFDFIALLCALRAVGAQPSPSIVLIAYVSATLLGWIPLTPGGLGFVEAGLVGTLALAGVNGGDALVATLAYRLVAFWLPIPIGGVAYLLFRRRYGASQA
jgi:uncharacterized protein (TIRG00374 family)